MNSHPSPSPPAQSPEAIGRLIAELEHIRARLDAEMVRTGRPHDDGRAERAFERISDACEELGLRVLRLPAGTPADLAYQAAIGAERAELLIDCSGPESYLREIARGIQKTLLQVAAELSPAAGADLRELGFRGIEVASERALRAAVAFASEPTDLPTEELLQRVWEAGPSHGQTVIGGIASEIAAAGVPSPRRDASPPAERMLAESPRTVGDIAHQMDVAARVLSAAVMPGDSLTVAALDALARAAAFAAHDGAVTRVPGGRLASAIAAWRSAHAH